MTGNTVDVTDADFEDDARPRPAVMEKLAEFFRTRRTGGRAARPWRCVMTGPQEGAS